MRIGRILKVLLKLRVATVSAALFTAISLVAASGPQPKFCCSAQLLCPPEYERIQVPADYPGAACCQLCAQPQAQAFVSAEAKRWAASAVLRRETARIINGGGVLVLSYLIFSLIIGGLDLLIQREKAGFFDFTLEFLYVVLSLGLCFNFCLWYKRIERLQTFSLSRYDIEQQQLVQPRDYSGQSRGN